MVKVLLLLITLLSLSIPAHSLNLSVLHVDYSLGQSDNTVFTQNSDRSWTTFDPDGAGPLPSRKHLNATALYVNTYMSGAVVDDPNKRTIQSHIDGTARTSVSIRNLFLQAPWEPETSYVVDDKVSAFTRDIDYYGDTIPAYPNTTGYWTCTVAGTSGTTEPVWTPKIVLPANWTDKYTKIRLSPWLAYDYSGAFGETVHIEASPWEPTYTNNSISTGFALKVIGNDEINNYYIWLSSDSLYVSHVYDTSKINHHTVATKVIQDGTVEWTYTVDISQWVIEGNFTGETIVKKRDGRFVDIGNTYYKKYETTPATGEEPLFFDMGMPLFSTMESGSTGE